MLLPNSKAALIRETSTMIMVLSKSRQSPDPNANLSHGSCELRMDDISGLRSDHLPVLPRHHCCIITCSMIPAFLYPRRKMFLTKKNSNVLVSSTVCSFYLPCANPPLLEQYAPGWVVSPSIDDSLTLRYKFHSFHDTKHSSHIIFPHFNIWK